MITRKTQKNMTTVGNCTFSIRYGRTKRNLRDCQTSKTKGERLKPISQERVKEMEVHFQVVLKAR
jgi:hypothetical protein